MNIKPILWTVATVILVVLAGSAVYAFFFAPQPGPTSPGGQVTLPGSGPAGTATSTPGGGVVDTLELPANGGGTILVYDFIKNGVTVQDTANADRYLLAGKLEYCASNPRCQAAPAENYLVYYNSGEQSFTIALTEEPLGQARFEVEQFMLKTLGIEKAQLCSVVYYVGVDSYTNEQYAGKNLGFSFCPGATQLPR